MSNFFYLINKILFFFQLKKYILKFLKILHMKKIEMLNIFPNLILNLQVTILHENILTLYLKCGEIQKITFRRTRNRIFSFVKESTHSYYDITFTN